MRSSSYIINLCIVLVVLVVTVCAQHTRVVTDVRGQGRESHHTRSFPRPGIPNRGITVPGYCGRQVLHPLPAKTTESNEPLSLSLVQVVIRHGDRTPVSGGVCWPGCNTVWNCTQDMDFGSNMAQTSFDVEYLPNRNVWPGNCMYGQLTSKGFEQHLANGKAFASAYTATGFLPSTLDPTQVWIRADESRRCRTSALALMEGLYPSATRNVTTERLVLHSMDAQFDDMTPNTQLCPKLGVYNQELTQSAMWQSHQQTVTAPLTAKLQQALNTTDSVSIHSFTGCLNCHLCHSMPYPPGITQELYNELVTEVTWESRMKYSYPNVTAASRLGIGFLLKEIVSNFDTPAGSPKFRLYSGHDSTLNPMLNALGLWKQLNYQWTPYASTLVFELYNSSVSTSKFVRMVYNGTPMTIPGCTAVLCPVTEFLDAVSAVLPGDDVAAECAATSL